MRRISRARAYSWKTKGFPNEAGSIGEKVARKWLEKKGFQVYFFQEIKEVFTHLYDTVSKMKRRRKKEYKENDIKRIHEIELFLKDAFGQKLEEMKLCDIAIRELYRLVYSRGERRAIGFDFIVRKDSDIFFIEVKVNKSELKKYQRLAANKVKEHGFQALVLRLNLEIEVGNSIQLIECK